MGSALSWSGSARARSTTRCLRPEVGHLGRRLRQSTGGFYDCYCTMPGIDEIIPVDVYVAGCPPRPEAFLEAIYQMQQKIDAEQADRTAICAWPTTSDRRGQPMTDHRPDPGRPKSRTRRAMLIARFGCQRRSARINWGRLPDRRRAI